MSDYPDYLNEQNYYDEVLGPPPEAEQINDLKVEDENKNDTSERTNQA